MKNLSELLEEEIVKIINNKVHFNQFELKEYTFSFHRGSEGVLFFFNDNSLKKEEFTLWFDKNSNQNHVFKEIPLFPTQNYQYTKLFFFNNPIRIFTNFLKYKSKTPSRSYASKIEYRGTWFAPYVTEWTHINESETIEIDEQKLKFDLWKNKLIFIKEVQKKIYLNNLFKEYKNSKIYA